MKQGYREINSALRQLIGLKLAVSRRAADMLILHFGKMRPAPKSDLPVFKNKPRGTIGDFALHIQCPWRVESSDRILTGKSDLWQPLERPEGFSYDGWDYSQDGNLQDKLMAEFLARDEDLTVDAVETAVHGSFTLIFRGGCQLVVFPSGTVSESWRLICNGAERYHLVVSGGAMESED